MDFRSVVALLEEKGKVVHVKSEVNPVHELAGIAKKFEGTDKIVVFDHVKGQKYPVVCGLWWNRDIIGTQFGVSAREVPGLFAAAGKSFQEHPVPPVVVDNPPCQEEVSLTPNLYDLTIPTLALEDGGAYFSNCVVIAKDPDTGVRNTSIHRLMVTGKNRLGLLMDVGRHLRSYYERAEAKGQSLEITINNGVDPAVYVCATYPGTSISDDELGVAAALNGGEPVRLSKSRTVGVEGLADAEVVLEGRILPKVREPEGPFGEVSGFYAQKDDRWVVEVLAVTNRKNPVMSTLLPGKEVWNSVGCTAEAAILAAVSKMVGGVKNVHLAHGNCGFFGCVLQMEPTRPGMGKNAIMAAFSAFPPMSMVTVVNSDVNIFDAEDVMRAITTRCNVAEDMVIIKHAACHELNPATDYGVGTKFGFDCTVKPGQEARNKKVAFMDVDLGKYDIV
ncbi:MAG: UbiD family decarboxylase [Spirochaetia bacterium]|nr:UbiD family decarboxylase [Spirochaetia bacterium]